MNKNKILALAILLLGVIYLLISLSLVLSRSRDTNDNPKVTATTEGITSYVPDITTPATNPNNTCSHILSTEWFFENDQHFHKCLVDGCDYTDTRISCTSGSATCSQKAVCQFCNNPYGNVSDHNWSTEWDFTTSSGHAHKCTFGCDQHSQIEQHVPGPQATENSDQICLECGYIIAFASQHTHTLQKADAQNATCTDLGNIEYYYCTGCSLIFYDSDAQKQITDPSAIYINSLGHDFAPATCTSPKTCQRDQCQFTEGKALGHTSSNSLSFNTEHHWFECLVCFEHIDQAQHVPGPDATETAPQICLECKCIIAPVLNHVHTTTHISAVKPSCTQAGSIEYYICLGCSKYFSDALATKEITILDSVQISSLGHDFAPATCTSPKICTREGCHASQGSALGHSQSTSWNSNAQAHWHLCTECGEHLEQAAHTPGPDATEQSAQICTTCGFVIAPKLEHTHNYNAPVQFDSVNHWYVCTCSSISSLQKHNDSDNDGKCDVCQYKMASDPQNPPETTNKYENETDKLDEILRPAQITLLRPVASGVLTKSNSSAIIDYSNFKDGYVMVKFTANTTVKLKVQVQGPTTTYTYNITPLEWTVFPLSDGNGEYNIKVFKNVTDNRYSTVISLKFTATLSDEFAPFLRPNQYVNYENAINTMNKAAELAAGKTDTLEKVRAIYTYITNNISYDYDKAATVESGYLPDLDQVLAEQKGICFDYAALMAGMLRSQNIACKLVVGYANTEYHAWISVWTPDKGWIDGAIFFDGVQWQMMDPTYASSSGSEIINKVTYTSKYIY